MKKALKHTLLFLLLVIGAMFTWSAIEPYTLDKEQYSVAVPHLSPEWTGARIAILGDFQVGMWLANESTVERAVNDIIEEQPAATLILGDFVYHASKPEGNEITRVLSLVEPLVEAGIPTYAVLGNHDYSLAEKGGQKQEELAARIESALETLGIELLQNEALALRLPAARDPLYIVGLGSHYARNDWPEDALATVPPTAARIVMMHNPESFPKLPAGSAPLAVAGHTHGGQLSLPFTPQYSLISLFLRGEAHAEGWIESAYGSPGNRLYVNRGIGMSLLPLRLLTPPELTYFILQPAADDDPAQPVYIE